eukprot:CAMPEP_0176439306 /NCGR_PEP_ID=MMETSP0127-20121128/19859_1 /TAXON_ID=938130 /ORGANISM="Platyophrya macrostoma, Strain WH" /LENGTH=208 /DNA_ID=CAMNT_0017823539 /DNA_START=76 /DNA_END=702 /DNA_ORIENTATION=-
MKVKVAVLGDSGVGKSCLIAVFSAIKNNRTDNFDEILADSQMTVGCDFVAVKFAIPNSKTIKMNIWDTAGQEKYRSINRNLYLGANGALLCFDLTRRIVNEDIDLWRKEVIEHAGAKCSIVIVGTKSDMDVNAEARTNLENYSKTHGLPYVETSSKTGSNVQEAFKAVANEIIAKEPKNKTSKEEDNAGFVIQDISGGPALKGKKGCC